MEMAAAPPQGERDPSFVKGMLIPWIICLLAALFYFYDFFLRVTPSVMIAPLMKGYNVGAMEIGFISAFYYYAYTPLQIPSGAVADKYSIRWVLTLSAFMCALGTFIFASFVNVPAALFGRALMGIGSAFAFVGALKLASLWLPKRHFALFIGLTTALGTIGAVFADTILSRMVDLWGWRLSVYVTGIAGLFLTLLLFLVVRDKPKWVTRMPRSYHTWKNTFIRIWELIGNWRFWINGAVGCFLFLPVSVFASLWGVAFLIQSYHLSPTAGATATSLIFVGTAVGSPLVGWISDRIKSRRKPIFVGGLLTFVFSVLLIYMHDLPKMAVFILLFLIGFFVSPQVLVFAIAREISPPRSTGISTATTNFFVTIGAAIFQPLIGYLLTIHWTGARTTDGIPLYSTSNYHDALLILPIVLGISFLLTFLLPKTGCHKLYEEPSEYHDEFDDDRPT